MRVLMIGAGGVGAAAAGIAARRAFFDLWVVADYDAQRADAVAQGIPDPRTRRLNRTSTLRPGLPAPRRIHPSALPRPLSVPAPSASSCARCQALVGGAGVGNRRGSGSTAREVVSGAGAARRRGSGRGCG